MVLRAHLAAHPKQMYLFETQRCGPYTVCRVQQIVQHYRETAGLSASVHLHLFRPQMLTFLTGQKPSDAQIQLLSGHASKKSLEVYEHLSLDAVDAASQQPVRFIDLWPPEFDGLMLATGATLLFLFTLGGVRRLTEANEKGPAKDQPQR